MTQQPTKSPILALLELLLSDIKDPKTLLLRAGTILLAILSYWVVAYQTEILEGFKNMSTETVLQKQKVARASQFPAIQRRESIGLLTQLNQDQVLVWEYEPKFLNNYINVVASEGVLQLKNQEIQNHSVDKSSATYISHLQQVATQGGINSNEKNWEYSPIPINSQLLLGQTYYFQQPLYDLSGVYSGIVLVLWKEPPPVTTKLQDQALIQYFSSKTQASRRTLERQK